MRSTGREVRPPTAEPNRVDLAKNPAYRPATEKALVTGLFLCLRFAGDSSGSLRGGLTAASVEPPGAVARRGLEGCAGYEPLRGANATTMPSKTRIDRLALER